MLEGLLDAVGQVGTISNDCLMGFTLPADAQLKTFALMAELMDEHGDACGEKVSYSIGELFAIYVGVLDNPSPEKDEYAAMRSVEITEDILDAASEWMGVPR